jgi:hypothetical protein
MSSLLVHQQTLIRGHFQLSSTYYRLSFQLKPTLLA